MIDSRSLWVDRQWQKKNKMADRFAKSNNILIQSRLKDNNGNKNKNTQQSTNNCINVWINRILVGGAC